MVARPPASIDDGPDAARGRAATDESETLDIDPERKSASSSGRKPATRDVAAIFDEIAPAYDRLTSVLSLWRDGRWRAAAVDASGVHAGDATIDVAAGTGKLAAALADRVGPFGRVVAVDLSPVMVERGRSATRDIVQIEFVIGDAAALAFADAQFDAATIAFGLRVMPDRGAVLAELRRVVKPGGRVVCLEPTTPRPRWWGRLYEAGVHRLAPLAGTATGSGDAYRRLAASVKNVADAATLIELMRRAGLIDIRHRGLWMGAVSLCVGRVPG